jgi:hypothetical protein
MSSPLARSISSTFDHFGGGGGGGDYDLKDRIHSLL